MLIHGAQTPWQVWTSQIEYFSHFYHVLVPVLPGHDVEDPSTFTTLEAVAQAIQAHTLQSFGATLHAVLGMSLGGTLASILWTNNRLSIHHLVLDGAPLVPQSPFITALLTRQYLALTQKTKARDAKTLKMAEINFISLRHLSPFLELMDGMSPESIVNFTASVGRYRLKKHHDISRPHLLYLHGTKLNEMVAKKSAKHLLSIYPSATVKGFKGYGHCELSIFQPEKYIQLVSSAIL